MVSMEMAELVAGGMTRGGLRVAVTPVMGADVMFKSTGWLKFAREVTAMSDVLALP